MNLSIYRISLDVHDAHSSVCLDMKQKDTARKIAITLTDGGFPYRISDECYAVFAATKPDGKKLLHHCSIERNTILYDVRKQTTAAVGLCECEIKLYGSGDKLLLSPGFNILVSEDAVEGEDELVSEDEVDALTHLISEATTVITKGEEVNAEAEALIAELETEKTALEGQVAAAEEAAEDAKTMAQSARNHANTAEAAAYRALQYSAKPDLAQNDPAVPGYIKNRTHWVESSETVIAWDGNVKAKRTYTDAFGKIYYKISDKCPEESDVIGATIEYSSGNIQTVSSKMFSGFTDGQAKVGSYIYLRSTPAVSAGNVIDADAVGVYAAIVNDVYPAVFRYGKDVVHTLDEKFIPDTIARKTDIPTVPDSSQNGKDGFSPVATVEQTDSGAVVSITDKDGTTTATIINGKDGKDGADGQPGKDGADGAKGDKGDKGDTGATGAQGDPGKDGANGKDGTSATHSWNGTVLTISSASGTSSADLKGAKGDKGDKGDTGAAGKNGADGYTPVKGTDYFTEADKANIIADVTASLSQIEAPKIVSSVAEMTDPTKHYVLDGYIYHHKTVVTVGEPTYPNVFDKSTATINGRLSVSNGAAASATNGSKGCFITDFIELKNWAEVSSYMVRVNFELQSTDMDANEVFFFNESKTLTGTYVHMFKAGSVVTIGDGKTSFDLKQWEAYSSAASAKYVKLRLYKKASGTAITTADLNDVEITFDAVNVPGEDIVSQEWVNSGISYAPTLKTDLIGVLGENNVIYLSNNLPAGTYTLKSSDDYAEVCTITVE